MAVPFLDTNILLRHLRQDNPVGSPTATAILARSEHGELAARFSDIVVFATVFTLQKTYQELRNRIAAALFSHRIAWYHPSWQAHVPEGLYSLLLNIPQHCGLLPRSVAAAARRHRNS